MPRYAAESWVGSSKGGCVRPRARLVHPVRQLQLAPSSRAPLQPPHLSRPTQGTACLPHLNTSTGLDCPSLCTRSMAWSSTLGFHLPPSQAKPAHKEHSQSRAAVRAISRAGLPLPVPQQFRMHSNAFHPLCKQPPRAASKKHGPASRWRRTLQGSRRAGNGGAGAAFSPRVQQVYMAGRGEIEAHAPRLEGGDEHLRAACTCQKGGGWPSNVGAG